MKTTATTQRWTMLVLALGLVFTGCTKQQGDESSSDMSSGSGEPVAAGTASPMDESHQIVESPIGEVRNVHRFGNIYLAGATSEDDISLLKEAGIERLVNIRLDGEYDFNEAQVCETTGIEYIPLQFNSPESLTDEVFAKGREVLKEGQGRPTMMHCGSANRVGAIWLAHRVLDDGLSYDEALTEAQTVGLRSQGLIDRTKEYVESQQAE